MKIEQMQLERHPIREYSDNRTRGRCATESHTEEMLDRQGSARPAILRRLILSGLVTVLIVLVLFGEYILPSRFYFDSEFIVELSKGHGLEDADPSFYLTGLFFALIPESIMDAMLIIIGIIALRLSLTEMLTPKQLISIGILAVPYIVLSLARPTKEVLLVVCMLLVIGAVRYIEGTRRRIFCVVVMYVAYGFFIRPYYLLIGGMVILGIVVANLRSLGRIVLACGIMVAILVLEQTDAIDMLLAPQRFRDEFNSTRLMSSAEGFRTAFLNPVEPEGIVSFAINYIYAAIRLSFPGLFTLDPLDVMMCGLSPVFGLILSEMLFIKSLRSQLFFILVLSHVFVLWIFEPDVGSYLRHLTSLLPYLGEGVSGKGVSLQAAGSLRMVVRGKPALLLSARYRRGHTR